MERINRMLQKIETLVGSCLLGLIFALIMINIVSRYILNSPLSWADEANSFMYVWLGFLACAYTLGNDEHTRLTILESRIPYGTRQMVRLVMDIIILLTFILFMQPVLELLPQLTKSPAMRLPLKYVYLILPISFALFILHTIYNICRRIHNFRHYRSTGEKLGELSDS